MGIRRWLRRRASGRGAHARSGGRRWIRCERLPIAGAELVGDGSDRGAIRARTGVTPHHCSLRVPEKELDTDRPFAELGLNSLMAMAIRREAEQFVGIELSATMLFNHPTVKSLASYLAKRVAPHDVSQDNQISALSSSAGSVLDSLFDRIESAPPEAERSV